MFSLLNSLDEYIKEKGIPFKYFKINYSYFPDYINQAILNHIRKNCIGSDLELGPENYQLGYSNNGILYLLAKDSKEHVNIVISATNEKLDLDFPCQLIPEKRIVREACYLKTFEKYRTIMREVIRKEELNISQYEKVLLENKLVNAFCDNKHEEMYAAGEDILNDANYEESLKESYAKIVEYIDYLNKMYQESINGKYGSYHMNGIRYNEPVGTGRTKNNVSLNLGDSSSKERVNQVIPASDRIDAIEKYPFLYKDYAYKDSTKEIIFMNYLFRTSKDNYILLIEPYNGMGYTKMIFIDSEEFISRDDFANKVRYYLELPFMELLEHNNVINCCHTKFETFESALDCALMGSDSDVINIQLQKKLENLRNQR